MSSPLCLVTGAPGWLGSRFVDVLQNGLPEVPAAEAGRRVRCLVMPGTPTAALATLPPEVELVQGDVRDPRALRDFFRGAEGATLFHLCGVITRGAPATSTT